MEERHYLKHRSFNRKKCDRIEVDKSTMDKILEWAVPIEEKNNNSFAVNPMLHEGIIGFQAVFFGVLGTIEVYFKVIEEGIYFNLLDRPVDFFLTEEGVIQIDAGELTSTPYYQNLSDAEAIDALQTALVYIVKTYCFIMMYIEYVRENPKIVEVHKERRMISKKPKGGKGKSRKIPLNRTVYKVTYDENVPKPSNRQFERHTDSWVVSGHPRHYKSGKVIYIQPYVKGKGERDPKTYVLNPDNQES